MLRYNNSLHDALPIYPADHVRGILDGGVLDVLDGDLVGTLGDEGPHDVPFGEEAGRGVHWRGGLTHRPSIPRGRGGAGLPDCGAAGLAVASAPRAAGASGAAGPR